MIFAQPAVVRTVADNIAYMKLAVSTRGGDSDRVAELLALVGLTDQGNKYPSQLSGDGNGG